MLENNNKPVIDSVCRPLSITGQEIHQFNKSMNKNMLNLNITKNNKNLFLSNHFFFGDDGKPKSIAFRICKNNQEIDFILKGQKAKTLSGLILNGNVGITAMEISKTFALRLSEYIRSLRHDNICGGYNLDIEMIRENNPVGWNGRYILSDKVEIISDLEK